MLPDGYSVVFYQGTRMICKHPLSWYTIFPWSDPQQLFISLFLYSYYLRAVSITSVESPLVSMMAGTGIYVQAGRFNEAWGYGAILPLGRLSTSQQLATMRWLIDAGTSMHSLSLPLSVVETSRRTWIVLVLAWWPSSAIVCISVRVLRILAVVIIWGRHLIDEII